MIMKKILMIAPDSFPLNGAESIVNLKLLKALSKDGRFTIDLISKKNQNQEYGQNSLEELEINLHSINIVEVDNKINLKTIWGHVMCLIKFGIVFKGSHWAYTALKVAEKLVSQNRYDYILTKNLAAPLLGCYLKRKYHIKWVATWNDPYPDCLYPEVYAKMLGGKYDLASKSLIKIINKYTDINIFPSTHLRDHLLPYYKIGKDRTIVIPHVVNESELHKTSPHSTLCIIHSGRLAYPRDSRVFLQGLKMFVTDTRCENLKIDFLGSVDDRTKRYIKEYNLNDFVQVKKPVSYKESLDLLDEYDVALIIEAQCKGVFLPTKVSDFMQKCKAIFAVSPTGGVLNDLYVKGNIQYFADNTRPESVCEELRKIYNDFLRGNIKQTMIPYEYTEKSVADAYYNL